MTLQLSLRLGRSTADSGCVVSLFLVTNCGWVVLGGDGWLMFCVVLLL